MGEDGRGRNLVLSDLGINNAIQIAAYCVHNPYTEKGKEKKAKYGTMRTLKKRRCYSLSLWS
jgi:hypothetical protein